MQRCWAPVTFGSAVHRDCIRPIGPRGSFGDVVAGDRQPIGYASNSDRRPRFARSPGWSIRWRLLDGGSFHQSRYESILAYTAPVTSLLAKPDSTMRRQRASPAPPAGSVFNILRLTHFPVLSSSCNESYSGGGRTRP